MKKWLVISCWLLVVGLTAAQEKPDTTRLGNIEKSLANIGLLQRNNNQEIQNLQNTIITSKARIYDLLIDNQNLENSKNQLLEEQKKLKAKTEPKK